METNDDPRRLLAVDGSEVGLEPINLLVRFPERSVHVAFRLFNRPEQTLAEIGLGEERDEVDRSAFE